MTEEYKSPWQIEHERMLKQEEAKRKAQERAKRARFLRGLKLSRKSERNLHQLAAGNKENQKAQDASQPRTLDLDLEDEEEKSSIRASLSLVAPTFRRLWPILLVFLLVFLGSLYALSPISRIGTFDIKGNQVVQSAEIAKASHLKMQDSIYHILLNKGKIEAEITNSSPRIKSTEVSIGLPNHVRVTVNEFNSIGYVEQKGKDYAILANGTKVSERVIPADQLDKNALLLKDFTDEKAKQFAQAYSSLKTDLQKMIRTVTLTPTQTTSDFITLQMSDGNQVKVPLSQMKEKFPYYSSIARNIEAPMTVDMEAGIFAAPTPAYNAEFAGDKPVTKASTKSAASGSQNQSANSESSSSSE